MEPTLQQNIDYVQACAILTPEQARALLLSRRQALLIELGAIERCLELPRSVTPKAERERERA